MGLFGERQRRLAAEMKRRGDWPAGSPWIRQAVGELPRHLFAPDRLWHWDGHHYQPVDRSADAERWAGEVYAGPDEATVTQVTDGRPTSSLSCQGVVVDMLESLFLEPGRRVLELGTGAGWNAALLAWRAGTGQVTSVEIDPALAARARQRLSAAHAVVAVEVADGTTGWQAGAPYDRVIATYAVEQIPWPWLAQTRPGGRIVTPWGRLGHVALTVARDGRSAEGWIQGLAQFMPARGTDPGSNDFRQVRGSGPAKDERPVTRDLRPLRDNRHLRFAIRVALPDVRIMTAEDGDGMSAWLHDGTSSWATLSALGGTRTIAHQGGRRRLADELEQAWDHWLAEDMPDFYDFGMTVEPDRQYVWCRDPANGPFAVGQRSRPPSPTGAQPVDNARNYPQALPGGARGRS